MALTGKLLLPEARNPNTTGRDDHGVETFAPGLASAEGVHGGAQRLYHQLQVCMKPKSIELFLRGFELNYNYFRDLVTYERESGDVLERFNESLNMVRVNLATGSKRSL